MDPTMIPILSQKSLKKNLKKKINCLGEKTEKYITSSVPVENKLPELVKVEKKLQKLYLPDYNLLIAQDF